VQIELLADRPGFIPTLAEWHFREWAYLRPGDSVANRVRLLQERSGRTDLPVTFVASSATELLGSAMLIHHEMDTHPQFTPWLAGVFVAPAHRATALGAHSRNMSCARPQRAVIPPFISSRPALRISFHISAGVLSSKPGTKAPMSLSCRTPNSPNQTMKPTQHFVVSFRFMRTSILKVLDGLSLSR
jgi:hypothetical protein